MPDQLPIQRQLVSLRDWTGLKTNYTSRLSEIHIPVLIVHGAKDIGVPLKYAHRAASRLPIARLEVIENAGHWTQRDYPSFLTSCC